MLTKVSSFYRLSSDRFASSSGRTRGSAALSGVVGGKAYNRNVRVSRWQETAWNSKQLFAKLLI